MVIYTVRSLPSRELFRHIPLMRKWIGLPGMIQIVRVKIWFYLWYIFNMKKRTQYEDAPLDIAQALSAARTIGDFLPAPDQLVFKEEAVKVTLSLGKESVNFFKKKAKENHVPYQNMIKRVVDLYARHYMQTGA